MTSRWFALRDENTRSLLGLLIWLSEQSPVTLHGIGAGGGGRFLEWLPVKFRQMIDDKNSTPPRLALLCSSCSRLSDKARSSLSRPIEKDYLAILSTSC